MKPVTDPDILSQLDAPEESTEPVGKVVTDPAILSQLDAPSQELSEPNRLRAKYGYPAIEDAPEAIPIPEDRGVIGDIGAALVGGAVDVGETYARAARTLDPEGGIDVVRDVAGKVIETAEEAGEKYDILKPSEAAMEGGVRGAVYHGVRSFLPSVAAGLPGAVVGSVGGIPGAIGGFAASGGTIFGLAEKDRFLQEAREQGIEEDIAQSQSTKAALVEGGLEGVSNLIGGAILGIGSPVAKEGIKQTIREMLKTPIKTLGKNYLKLAAEEIPTEMAQEGFGSKLRRDIGMEAADPWEAAFGSIGPTLVATALFAAGGTGLDMRYKKKLKQTIADPNADPKKRIEAVNVIAGNLAKQEEGEEKILATAWQSKAYDAIRKGQPIDIDENVMELAQTIPATDQAVPTEAIESQDTVDAAIKEDVRTPTLEETVERVYQEQQAAIPATDPERESDIEALLREIQEAKAEEAAPGDRARLQGLVEEAYIKQQAIPTEAIDSQETVDEQIKRDATDEEAGLEEIGPVEVYRVDNASGPKRDHFTFVGPEARSTAEREAAKLATAEGRPQAVYAVPPEEVFDKGGKKVGTWPGGADVYENAEKLDTGKFEAVTGPIQPMSDERVRSINRLRIIKDTPAEAEAAAQRLGVDRATVVEAAEAIDRNGMPTNDIERSLVNMTWADELTGQVQAEVPAPMEAPVQAALPLAPEPAEIERPVSVFDDMFAGVKKPKEAKKPEAAIAAIPTKTPAKEEAVGEVYVGDRDGYKLYVDEAAGKEIIEHPSGSRLVRTIKDGKETREVIGSAADFEKRTKVQELDDARELGVSLEARSPEADTGISKPTRDSSPADTKLFGDISNAEAIRVQGFKSLDRERQHMVVSSMVPALHEKKILDFIIETVPINVMNDLIGKKFSTKGLLDNPAMLTNRLAIPSNKAISMPVIRFIDSLASSLKGGLTRLGAKKSSLIFPVTQGGVIVDTAISADQDPTRPVTRLARLGAEELALPIPDTTIPSTEAISTGRTHKDSQIHTSVINEQVVNVDINPTEAQKQAGNYLKGTLNIQGLNIAIENPKGSERTGKEDGTPWTAKMHIDYGYIKESEGADGEHVDVYIGPNPESETAYAVHQIEPETGQYDEDKVMIGFDSQSEAETAYRKQYDQGMKDKPNRIGAITSIALDVLKKKIAANETIGEEAIKQIEYKPEIKEVPSGKEAEERKEPAKAGPIEEDGRKEVEPTPQKEVKEVLGIQEGDILTKSGKPFKSERAARTGIIANKKQNQGFIPIEVEGGWVARSEKVTPKLKIEPVKAEHDGEPVTETETKEILKDAKKEAKDQGIAPAEQKTFLLSEIDEALKDAPPQEDKPTRMFDKVKIEVPGDGVFDIVNTKEALTEFKALVKKNFPGKEAAKRVTKKYVLPKPTAGKAQGLKDVRLGVYEGKPYHTDGHIILLTKPALKPKQVEDSRWEDRPTIEASTLKDLIPKGGNEVTDIEFVAYEKGESQSISNLPIPDLREDKRFTGAPKARLISEKGEVYIAQEYYNYVIRHFPDADFYTTDEASPVLVKDGKKTVGIVMPIRIEAAEAGVKEVRIPEEVPAFKKKDFLGEALPVERIKEVPLKADIEAAVDIITTKWKNRDIKTVSRINQLPSHLHDSVIAAKGEKDIEGIFDPATGRVYLIAGNIDSLERARTVLFHESLGHFGIRGLLGKDITPVLNQVYIKYRAEAHKIAIKYEFDLSTEQGRRQASEEVLANIAQINSDPGILKKAFAAIRDWLRKMGFDIELSDNDIRSMMAQAAAFTREGKKPSSATAHYKGLPMFARKEAQPVSRREHTPEVKAALEKVAPEMEPESVKERLAKVKENLGVKIKQAVVDQYASLREFTEHGYVLARMSNTSTGALEAAFRHGKLRMTKEGGITVDTNGKGLANVLAPLGGELNDFFAWIAGNRAEGLAKEDRERLFDKTDIKALKTLNQGQMADGKARPAVYAQVHKEFKAFQESVLDIAEKSGLVNKEERATWEQDFYIPFYRVLEEQADVKGPKTLESLTGQTAIKRLKGADIKLNDLLSNVLMNWNHLLNASLKNNAATVSLEAAADMGAATQVRESDKAPNSVFVRKNGRKVWYDVSEPLILESLTSLNWEGFNSRALKAMRKFKRAFTIGVTASPEFRIANLLRDTVHSIAVGKMKYNMLDNALGTGWKGTQRESITEARMMAGGGKIHFGHAYGADPDAAKLLIEKGIKDDYILDNPKAFKSAKQALHTFWDTWAEFGSRLENVNRAALYENRVKEIGDLRANFEARDLMDFTNYGAAPAVRFLIQIVPFMNARMQGLYKLGKAAMDKDQQRQLAAVTSMVALASMALFLTFKDDDDFKEREEWDRDTYWWFKVPGSDKAFRIPKPFEVGAIGTLAERMLEQIVDDEVHGELFSERLGHMIVQTFAFSVVPQMLQPTLDVYSNINPFTDRPIESMGMERLSKTERKKAWTSETTIAISKGMDAVLWDKVVLSPVQIEYMVKGYLGWIGAMTLGTIDNIFMETLTDAPTDPTRRIDDYPAVGRFVRSNPSRNTKYATLFYEQLQEMNTAYSDVQNYRKLREFNKAKESQQKNVEKLRWRSYFNQQQKRLSKITGRMKLIQLNKVMSAAEKRAEIDLLQREKNRILKIAVERRDI